jgi:hypothetical protein
MLDLLDVELEKSDQEARCEPLPGRVPASWVVAVLAASAIGVGAYLLNSGDAISTNEVTVSLRDAPNRR